MCPAGTDELFGATIATAVFDGLKVAGLIEQHELADEQKAEFVRRSKFLDPPAKGWFVAPEKPFDGPPAPGHSIP